MGLGRGGVAQNWGQQVVEAPSRGSLWASQGTGTHVVESGTGSEGRRGPKGRRRQHGTAFIQMRKLRPVGLSNVPKGPGVQVQARVFCTARTT